MFTNSAMTWGTKLLGNNIKTVHNIACFFETKYRDLWLVFDSL